MGVGEVRRIAPPNVAAELRAAELRAAYRPAVAAFFAALRRKSSAMFTFSSISSPSLSAYPFASVCTTC